MDNKIELTPEERAKLEKAIEESNKPIEMSDKDFGMSPKETDIRKLCKANKDQLFFRLECQKVAYLKTALQNQVDIIKLQMLICKKLGIEDIGDAVTALEDELRKDVEKHEKVKN